MVDYGNDYMLYEKKLERQRWLEQMTIKFSKQTGLPAVHLNKQPLQDFNFNKLKRRMPEATTENAIKAINQLRKDTKNEERKILHNIKLADAAYL